MLAGLALGGWGEYWQRFEDEEYWQRYEGEGCRENEKREKSARRQQAAGCRTHAGGLLLRALAAAVTLAVLILSFDQWSMD